MAKKKFEDYKRIAEMLVDADAERDRMFEGYERMYHGVWELPPELRSLAWVRKEISSDPHDAIIGGRRVLTGLKPRIRITPLLPDSLNKQKANQDEKNLSWQLEAANRRRGQSVQADFVQSALLYDAIFATVIDLDYQGADSPRAKMARRVSRFVVPVFNPRDVHVRRSHLGPELIVLKQKRYASAVMDEWDSSLTKALAPLAEKNQCVYYWDVMDYERRCVFTTPYEGEAGEVVIVDDAHGLDFFPWIAFYGGSGLEWEEKNQYHPMLFSTYATGQWDTQNMVRSLYTSEVIAHASAPRFREQGPNPEQAVVDYADPTRTAKVPVGNQLDPMPPPPIDQALTEVDDRVSGSIQKSTLARVLLGGDTQSGEAFAALNLRTQTAIGSLKPAKELAEKALAEMFTLMLLWTRKSEIPMTGMGQKASLGAGETYVIQPSEIEPSAIYIEVELTPDVATDRQARINSAAMARQFGLSQERALEEIGIEDPIGELKKTYTERLFENKLAQVMQAAQAEMQMQIQQMQMAMQQQAAQEAQASMIPQGPGANPAEGGLPPQMTVPGATFEGQTGEDRAGQEISGLGVM